MEHAFGFRQFACAVSAMGLVLAGISIFAYIGSLVVEALARGVIGGLWAERRRRGAIEALHDHYIICGIDRFGRCVAQLFAPRETLAR